MLLVDSWTDVQYASSTCGIIWYELRCFSSVVLTDMLRKVRCALSVTALVCGWKAVVQILSFWRCFHRLPKNVASKVRLWTELKRPGQPKWITPWTITAVVVVESDWSGNGTSSWQLVKQPLVGNVFWLPADGECGPKKQIPTVENGELGVLARRL